MSLPAAIDMPMNAAAETTKSGHKTASAIAGDLPALTSSAWARSNCQTPTPLSSHSTAAPATNQARAKEPLLAPRKTASAASARAASKASNRGPGSSGRPTRPVNVNSAAAVTAESTPTPAAAARKFGRSFMIRVPSFVASSVGSRRGISLGGPAEVRLAATHATGCPQRHGSTATAIYPLDPWRRVTGGHTQVLSVARLRGTPFHAELRGQPREPYFAPMSALQPRMVAEAPREAMGRPRGSSHHVLFPPPLAEKECRYEL